MGVGWMSDSIPAHLREAVERLTQVHRELRQNLGRDPSFDEIVEVVYPIDMDEFRARLSQHYGRQLHAGDLQVLGQEVRKAKAFIEDRVRELIELSPISVELPPHPRPEPASSQVLREKMEVVLQHLGELEQRVLRMRFGLMDGQPKTLEEVGQELGMTRDGARKIEAGALRKLRHPRRGTPAAEEPPQKRGEVVSLDDYRRRRGLGDED